MVHPPLLPSLFCSGRGIGSQLRLMDTGLFFLSTPGPSEIGFGQMQYARKGSPCVERRPRWFRP